MRVTSSFFPATLKSQLGTLQAEQQRLQTQLATGLRVTQASDDPTAFAAAQRLGERQALSEAQLESTRSARDLGNYNHAALADLQRLLSRANELVTRSGGISGPEERRILGFEMEAITDQVVSTINRQRDGTYLFGGTANVAPVVVTSAGPPPVYAYNPASNGAVTRSQISDASTVDTGFAAGRAGAFDGILVGGGVDALAALQSARNLLLSGAEVPAGSPTAVQLRGAGDRISEFVGRSAARLSVLDLNEQNLRSRIQNGAVRLAEHTQANLTDVVTDLQRVQLNYQAALQSGASILNMSLMNYLR
jgi:flagellar hook-associated protein 3 FlgL